MKEQFDVIIVGGGIIGTATGYYLSKRGLRVLVLEKDFLTADCNDDDHTVDASG